MGQRLGSAQLGVPPDVFVDVDPLAGQRDDDHRRGVHGGAGGFPGDGPEPGQVVVGEHEEGLALAESGRGAADRVGQDSVEAASGNRLGGELPHHPAATDGILEIHGAE